MRQQELNSVDKLIPTLTGEADYPRWKRQIRLTLAKNELLPYISRPSALTKEGTSEKDYSYEKYENKHLQTIYYLTLGMDPKIQDQFATYFDLAANELWDALASHYEK